MTLLLIYLVVVLFSFLFFAYEEYRVYNSSLTFLPFMIVAALLWPILWICAVWFFIHGKTKE